MTYGDNVSDLRQAMTALLERHRIRLALGGANGATHPNQTTEAQKQAMGFQIQQYRCVVLAWCATAVDGVAPKFTQGRQEFALRSPAVQLQRRITDTVGAIGCGLPSMESVARPAENALVETWRKAARACILTDPDMGAVTHTRLDAAQSRAVLKDAADFIRGLIVLDRRYANVPGWEHLANPRSLDVAAQSVVDYAGREGCDFSIDAHGQRHTPAVITGQALPAIAGVIQAQHNLLVDLTGVPPTGMNMRRILSSQTGLSHELVRHAASGAPELAETFQQRADVYRDLAIASRNFGGLIGNGGPAAAESANAYDRARSADTCTPTDAPALHELSHLAQGIDTRIATTIELGFADRIYFVSVAQPGTLGLHQGGHRWVPATTTTDKTVLPIVRERLRPTLTAVATVPMTHERQAYGATLAVQPGFGSPRV
ncbi:MAG: hypothetical protein ACSLEW_13970 [Nocardioides sp.]